jgi:hypothetical protein
MNAQTIERQLRESECISAWEYLGQWSFSIVWRE